MSTPSAPPHQTDSLQSISALLLLESFPNPAFVLPALQLDEMLVQRVRVARTTDPEEWGNSLLPPDDTQAPHVSTDRPKSARTVRKHTVEQPVRPTFSRTDSAHSYTGETVVPDSVAGHTALAYPGITGPEADVGMRHSIRDLTTPIWVNAAWRNAFEYEGDGMFSFFECLNVDDGVKFCEFLQELMLSSRKPVLQRRPVTVQVSLQPSAWRALPPDQRVLVPVRLVGNIVNAEATSVITASSFIVCTFAADSELPTFAMRLMSLHDEELTTPLEGDLHLDIRQRQFGVHASKHANPQAPSKTIPDGFVHEGSLRESQAKKKRKASKTSFGGGGADSRPVRPQSPLVERHEITSPPSSPMANGDDDDETPSAVQNRDSEMNWTSQHLGTPNIPAALVPEGLEASSMTPFTKKLISTEMGRAILRYPWHQTLLGPITTWSSALQTCVGYCMSSPFREALWVGEELLMMYNDGYIATAGGKHPWLLGKAGAVAWAEIWDELKPSALRMMAGETITSYDGLLFIDRMAGESGAMRPEETYFTWSWIPIFDESGKFVAAHNPAFESTSRVIAERRLATLRDIVQTTSLARETSAYCQAVLAAMANNPFDLPFALLYSASRPQMQRHQTGMSRTERKIPKDLIKLKLEGALGVPYDHPSAPAELSLRADPCAATYDSGSSLSQSQSQTGSSSGLAANGPFAEDDGLPWPFAEAITTGKPVFVSDLSHRIEGFELRGWNDPCHSAVILPIASDDASTHAIAIVGLNPRRPWNEVYATFFQLLSRQLATGLATVLSYESAQAKADELAALDKARNAFFQNCSHELRTPLTLILGPLDDVLSSKEAVSSGVRSQLLTVNRNSHRLLRLVNSLLDFSKLEAGRVMANFTSVNLGQVTADLASLFRSSIERAKIDYIVDCDEKVPPLGVFVDTDLWEKAATNLIQNAFKYTIKGKIKVSLKYQSNMAFFSVNDTGCGIPDEERDLIFERFHRIDSVGRSIEGTGIGLALTLEIVKLLGGALDVASKVGVGSTFSIRLPLGKAHLPDDRIVEYNSMYDSSTDQRRSYRHTILDEVTQWPVKDTNGTNDAHTSDKSDLFEDEPNGTNTLVAPSPLSMTGSKILVADDNADMRRYCRSILSSAHYTIIEMPDGQTALDYALANPPDCIVSDIMMGNLDGFGLLQQIRNHSHTRLIPVILLSAKAGAEARVEGLLAGADDYLVKPFSGKELLARVANHVAMGKMRRELEKRVEERTIALSESETRARELAARLTLVTDLSPVGIFSTDGTGQLLYVNPQFYAISGLSVNEPINDWLSGIHPEDRANVQTAFKEAVAGRNAISLDFRWSSGTWTHMGIHPLEQNEGETEARFVGSLTDTSELKRLEALHISTLEQRAVEAEQMRRLQEVSVDVSSHELRNPLSGLHQNAELISDSLKRLTDNLATLRVTQAVDETALDSITAEIQDDTESVESILLASAHMQRIAQDILNFGKANMGLLTLAISTFSMRALVEGCLRMFSAELKNYKVTSELDCNPSMAAFQAEWIKGDPHRLSQVLINLLTNVRVSKGSVMDDLNCSQAVRFLAPRPIRNIQVRISAFASKPAASPTAMRAESDGEQNAADADFWISTSVTDTGPGLTAEERQKLFRRFGQANPAIDSLSGFGLGLFVSRKIVEMHGGYIEVESVKGEGSTFSFCFPTHRAEAPPRPTRMPSDAGVALPTKLNRADSVKIASGTAAPSRPSSRLGDSKGNRGMVLVADDNMINLRVLIRQLQSNGFSTISASDGLEVIQVYEKASTAVDILLLDVEMPMMTGIEAVKKIRETESATGRPRVAAIAVTGNARDKQIEACLEAGFDDVAVKPYRIQDLIASIQKRIRDTPASAPA